MGPRALGWLFGFALASAVSGGLCAGCHKKRAPTAQPVVVSTGDYRISFPDTPQPAKHKSLPTAVGTAQETSTILQRKNGSAYSLELTEYPSGSILSEQGAVDGALRGANSSAPDENLKLTSDRRVTLGSCNGRLVTAKGKTYTVSYELCVSGSRNFSAITAVPNDASPAEVAEASAFLASFSVIASPAETAKAAASAR
jgi:hypothetical protein